MGGGYPTARGLKRWENVSTPVLLCMVVSMQYVSVCEVSEVDTFSRVDFPGLPNRLYWVFAVPVECWLPRWA